MIPYILIFLIVAFGYLYEQQRTMTPSLNKDASYVLYFLGFASIIFMTGVRDMIGGYDVYVYARYFEDIPPLTDFWRDWNTNPLLYVFFEPGYLVFNSLVRVITSNAFVYFFIAAFVSYLLMAKSIYRYPYFLFALFILFAKFFIVGFVYTRQFLAMGVVWWSLRYLYRGQALRFALMTILAATIHISAAMVLPLAFIYKRRFSGAFLSVIFAVCLVLGVTPLMKILMGFVGELFMITKLSIYSGSEQAAFHLPYFVETSVFAFLVLRFRRILYSEKLYAIMTNFLIMYIVYSFLMLREATAIRFVWYCAISYIVIIPYIVSNYIRPRLLAVFLALLYFSFMFFRDVVVRDHGNFLPYKATFTNTYRDDDFENS